VRDYTKTNIDPQPALPLPLRVFCRASISPYDFSAKRFSLQYSSGNCAQISLFNTQLIVGFLRRSVRADLDPSLLPQQLPMPETEAESFWNATSKQELILSYDADLVALESERFNPTDIAAAVTYKGNAALYIAPDITQRIHEFEDVLPTPQTAAPSDPVDVEPVPDAALRIKTAQDYEPLATYFESNLAGPTTPASYFDVGQATGASPLPIPVFLQTANYIPDFSKGASNNPPRRSVGVHQGGGRA